MNFYDFLITLFFIETKKYVMSFIKKSITLFFRGDFKMEEFIIGESVSCDDFLIEETEEDPKEELNEDEEKCE